MRREDIIGSSLSLLGAADSLYLFAQSIYESIPLYCPPGVLNCTPVITSQYSKFLGIPVSLLGLVWFVVMLALFLTDSTSFLLPLWIVGVIFVLYLIYIEVFVIHYICPYCTVAHASCFLIGIPVFTKLKGLL